MKRLIILLSGLLLCLQASAQADRQADMQELQRLMGPVPADRQIRTGRLDNGLTYYIRHNEKPKGTFQHISIPTT